MVPNSLVLVLYFITFTAIFTCGSCGRIINGRQARPGEFPYQVTIKHSFNDEHRCGGSIITSRFILTAAHCLKYIWGGTYPSIIISVVAGQIDNHITETSVFRNASRIILHEDFDSRNYANDIALIELSEDLPKDNNLISGIPLNPNTLKSGNCIVSGWGVQEDGSLIISDILMAAKVDVVEFSVCEKMYDLYEEELKLSEGMMCAGHINGETDACGGDSGGPLVCDGLLTGIVSAGATCGSPKFPGIYTDISKYTNWIWNKINSTTVSTSTTIANYETTKNETFPESIHSVSAVTTIPSTIIFGLDDVSTILRTLFSDSTTSPNIENISTHAGPTSTEQSTTKTEHLRSSVNAKGSKQTLTRTVLIFVYIIHAILL